MKNKKSEPLWKQIDSLALSRRFCGRCSVLVYPSKADQVHLNEVAQGLRSLDESCSTFMSKSTDEQLVILRELAFFCREASANRWDVRRAIKQAGLPTHFHPLWRPGRKWSSFGENFGTTKRGKRILDELNPQELSRQYDYLMRLFTIADATRRRFCGSNCGHWWHNLGPEKKK
jgi:hypothetical protein